MERIVNTELGVIREPLRAPFGFKGGTLSELWQTAVRLTLDSGASGMGVGVQSVLWSDPVTFCACDEAGGNERMLAVTRRALELLQGQAFTDPPGMTAGLMPELLAFARRLLGRADVPQTFVLNALVPVDFALWQLWNAKRGNGTFDALCASFCPELTNREKELGSIPLITYHTPEDELHALLEDGAFLLKVKIGSDPEKNGDPEAMLAWDIGRLRTVHTAAAGFTTPYTECGRPVYYLDANGRYPDREFLLRFLDAADKMDALERIVLELKDRVKKMGFTGGTLELTGTDDAGIVSASQNAEQAVQALIVLGYTQSEAAQAVAKLDGSLSTEELIRGALKSMASRF